MSSVAELLKTGNPDDLEADVVDADTQKQSPLDPWDLLVALVVPLEEDSEGASEVVSMVADEAEVASVEGEVSRIVGVMVEEGEALATKEVRDFLVVEVTLVEIVVEVGIPDPTAMALLLQMPQLVQV